MNSAALAILLGLCAGATLPNESLRPQQPPPQPPAPRSAAEPQGEPALEPEQAEEALSQRIVGPTPGAPTLTLAEAVRISLERNFSLLDSQDVVNGARWREKAARGQFVPSVTPLYQRFEQRSLFGLDLAQSVPWLGGSLSGSGQYTSDARKDAPYPRTTDLRLLYTQPLLRGFGPNASLFNVRNARRARIGQERGLTLARQRVAIDVVRGFYQVIAYRQLLDVARQSLARTEALLRASNARLEVGMASKLDVFRAEVQASQARDAMVRSESSLASALEHFRGLLALEPGDPVEPEAAALPTLEAFAGEDEVETLVRQARARRLELLEARDQVADARRAASYAWQNLLPQLDLNLSLTQFGFGGSFGDAWAAGDRRFELFVSTSYPLQQSSARANRALAQIEVGGRERALRQSELAIEQEVREALRQLEVIRKSVELQQAAVDVAAQQRRLAVLRYQRGLGSNFDVVEAEGSLVTARSALVQLLTSWAVARLELLRTAGAFDPEKEFAP